MVFKTGLRLKSFLIALVALVATVTAASADVGTIRLSFLKAGWVIGGTVGSGTLTFRGRKYPVSIGGLSYGLTFGGSQTYLRGTVSNIYSPRDVEGVYGAGSAGAAIVRGPQAVVLTNQKGAVMSVAGTQTGLILNLDLNGMALTLR
ncbi:MAG: hypothetical protein A4S14_01175 [Proteobacteria bacterium SG_bin9]|nr:MAG: hypothetical protein A4S14_01175 [Proteobacteria bacterium SG_bin9]